GRFESPPHRLHRRIAMGRLDRRGGVPLEGLDERPVRAPHQIWRAVRHTPFLAQDRQMIFEDVPKHLLLPFLRSIRRDDVDSHMSTRGRMARGHLRVMGGRRRIAYPLSTLAGSVNFFRTALSL